ncbi:MAG: IS3 family transposase [Candidatus Izemoplasmatales bacterium]|nr:IS3 family transposase [Candidatus Izemoplasmatales bacterium]
MNTNAIKLKIIDDFKNGFTTKDLIDKYGYSKTTINDWLRPTRLEIEYDDLKSLRKKYSFLCKEHEKMKIELEIYKSLECLPSSPRHVKLNAIEKYYNIYPVKTMCRILDVSVGTFYNHLNRRVEEKFNIKNDNFLRPLVMEVYNKSRQRFGSIKITQVLINEGYTISNKKSKHLMDELNIKPILGKKKKKDLSKIESKNIYLKNLIGKNFTRNNPNEAWTTDVTEVNVYGNPFFICVILDFFSRKVIGYRVHCKNNTKLVINTLKDAYENRNQPENVIVHSDRGSNYTSFKYRSLLKSLKLIPSYSKTARPTENAVVESFFSHFKSEEIYLNDYKTLEELMISVDEHVDFYNDFRPHHHLNGQTPNMYESKYILKNGLTTQLSDQSTLSFEIKKTFSSGQFNQKGSKVLL